MTFDWKMIGIHVNTKEEIMDVYVDGVRYPGSALAAPVRFSYEKDELKLKVTVWAEKDGKNDL